MEERMFGIVLGPVMFILCAVYYSSASQIASAPAASAACSDGTLAGFCSASKPYFCSASLGLVENSSCGCLEGETASNGNCVAAEGMRPLSYALRGIKTRVVLGLNESVYAYLVGHGMRFYCVNGSCPSERDMKLAYMDEPVEKAELLKIVDMIRNESGDRDDQARIAISMVQNIPFDRGKLQLPNMSGRYPYEVVYDGSGICEEKSRLLAFLLRELGYGTALLKYDAENHMAVGIKCADEYSNYQYNGTGYCFVETTVPSIIGDSEGGYGNGERLSTMPKIIQISGGITFGAGSMEYNDALEWKRIMEEADASPGRQLSSEMYSEWQGLVAKYGIPVGGN